MEENEANIQAVSLDHIPATIHQIRGEKVMLDSDLAALYRVETRVLKQAVRRNAARFPTDFMFELTREEWQMLQQKQRDEPNKQGGTRYLPFAFTEQGVAMLSGILNSAHAVQVNIAIMRTFVQLRREIQSSDELRHRFDLLEQAVMHRMSDQEYTIGEIYSTLNRFLEVTNLDDDAAPDTDRRMIGFHKS